MKIVQGDLIQLALEGQFDAIVHGCNCQCAMGKGIAKTIKETFPAAYKADCKTVKGDREKLGTISFVTVEHEGREITIINGYTQFHWRGPEGRADYDAIRGVMQKV
ncbi:MAG: macro domain-containing protein, partial [Planctomycetaceae bacterium]|nr:macro domain-containing protein [Planctomycetaceae bacterium]